MTDTTDARLARNEAEIEGLSKSLNTLSVSVEQLADSVHDGFRDIHTSIGDEMSKVYDRMNRANATSWPTIYTGIMVGFVVVGLFLSVYAMQRNEMTDSINKLEASGLKDAYRQGQVDSTLERAKNEIAQLRWRVLR